MGCTIQVSIPKGGAKDVSLPQNVQTVSAAHPTYCKMDTMGSTPGGKMAEPWN